MRRLGSNETELAQTHAHLPTFHYLTTHLTAFRPLLIEAKLPTIRLYDLWHTHANAADGGRPASQLFHPTGRPVMADVPHPAHNTPPVKHAGSSACGCND